MMATDRDFDFTAHSTALAGSFETQRAQRNAHVGRFLSAKVFPRVLCASNKAGGEKKVFTFFVNTAGERPQAS